MCDELMNCVTETIRTLPSTSPTMARLPYRRAIVAVFFILHCNLTGSVASTASSPTTSEFCSWELIAGTRDASMICRMNSLKGEMNPTNFSVLTPRRIVHLTIRCDDDAVRSEMIDEPFDHFDFLRILNIEGCKLGELRPEAFKGLGKLKHLTVKTMTTNWREQLSLKIHPGTLQPLQRVESVDFSENNLDALPADLLCGLGRLQFVNLTRNNFNNLSRTGLGAHFGFRCENSVRLMDMSHNRLEALTGQSFSSLIALEELRLNHNLIARIEATSMVGLSQLKTLDLAHNSLVALPTPLFRSTPKLSKLYLRDNSLSALPPGLLTGPRELTVLDLSFNQLSSLEWLGADGPSGLTHLDLSFNQLSRLDASVFSAVVNLQSLHLQNNLIEYIEDTTFSRLGNLHTLLLGFNRLRTVHSSTFGGLRSLVSLHLDNNRLQTVDEAGLESTPMLQELNVGGNSLRRLEFLTPLKMLRSLDLSENRINDITNASYRGLLHLHALNLQGNGVGNISGGVFSNLPSVRILNLARNGIQTIGQDTFKDVSELHYLRLDSNRIEDVNNLFGSLHNLIMLNISANRLRWFDYALIPAGLQWLDIHDNQIEALGNYFELGKNIRLRTLDASSNGITDLDMTALPDSIEVVYLANNTLKRIHPSTFFNKHNLSRVDLTNNLLDRVDESMLRLNKVPIEHRRPPPEFSLAGNTYRCSCHMEWLTRLRSGPSDGVENFVQYSRVVDLPRIDCELTYPKSSDKRPLLSLQPSQFLCPYDRHCPAQCACCDFADCECELHCPDGCSCYGDSRWSVNIVDCSGRRLLAPPRQLPTNATEVHLDGNLIQVLGPLSSSGRAEIVVLYANRSNIASVQARAFANLYKLRVLRLDGNRLSFLEGLEFSGLSLLRELHLSNNRLTFVSDSTFGVLHNLEILHLDGNLLTELSFSSFNQNNLYLTDLRLADNSWTCACDFTKHFADFIDRRSGALADLFDMKCFYNETSAVDLWSFNSTNCEMASAASNPSRDSVWSNGSDSTLTSPLASHGTLMAVLLITAFILLLALCRQKISMLIFSRCGIRLFYRPEIEEEKLFDAFVSYSRKDEAFVLQALASELECRKPAYRLCLHYRDLPMAGGYLSDAIHEAVDSSQRTVVVLSENFLKSDWSCFEFKSTHCEVLHNSYHKLIVIFVGEISYDDLDSNIRTWMRLGTFLHWGEKNFWEKLRSALPKARTRNTLCSDVSSIAAHI